MSVKKDPSGRRSVQAEIEVPGTPEQVWQAIASGPGVSAWFVQTEFVESQDGTPTRVVSHFGPGMDAVARVTAWEPPHRFAGEEVNHSPGAPPMATEWIVEARAGGTCVVRVVHSLFASTDDWDDQLENIESGWPAFFCILKLYLTNFAGQLAATFRALAVAAEPESTAWGKLAGKLGLAGLRPGQRWSAPAGLPALAGIVERVGEGRHPHGLILRLDAPEPAIVSLGAFGIGGRAVLQVSFYLYGAGASARAARDEPFWRDWMRQLFPPVESANPAS
jgi:uncharacterized protein YndB with AHSA1/START domain